MNNQILWILLIPVVAIGIYMFIRKRKQAKGGGKTNNQPVQRDEVWQTVKRKLREDGEIGKEIVDPYVQRRTGKEFKKRDIYVVLFSTRDSKTMAVSEPRALEVEVKTVKLTRKNSDRKVIVNGYREYATENAWISKLRAKELEKERKQKEKLEKKAAKKAARFNAKKKADGRGATTPAGN